MRAQARRTGSRARPAEDAATRSGGTYTLDVHKQGYAPFTLEELIVRADRIVRVRRQMLAMGEAAPAVGASQRPPAERGVISREQMELIPYGRDFRTYEQPLISGERVVWLDTSGGVPTIAVYDLQSGALQSPVPGRRPLATVRRGLRGVLPAVECGGPVQGGRNRVGQCDRARSVALAALHSGSRIEYTTRLSNRFHLST